MSSSTGMYTPLRLMSFSVCRPVLRFVAENKAWLPRALRRRYGRSGLQVQVSYGRLAHAELLDLARYRRREPIHQFPIARNFVCRHFAAAKRHQVLV